MQKAAMRAVVHYVMIKAVTDALLKNDYLMTPTATFVSNYVEKESNHVKMEKDVYGSKIKKIRALPPLPTRSDPSNDGGISSRDKNKKRCLRDRKISNK